MADHTFFWAYGKICRLEYIRGEAPAVFIPALLTASTFQALTATAVIEGIAVFALLYVTGFIVNALTDRELDLKYDSFKREIGEATGLLGERKVKAILVAHLAAALAITIHLAVTLRAPALLALVSLGIFLALAYSLPPFHLKVRGVAAHAFALALSAFAIPFLFLYHVASGGIDAYGWMVCGAFTLTHYGLTYTNQAYDFDEDLKEGVRTPPVRLGLKRALAASAAMVALGLPLLTFSLVTLALSRDSVAAAWGSLGAAAFALGTGVLLWLGYSVPLRGLSRMIAIAKDEAVESDAVPKIRREVDYAKFHAAGIASLAVFGLLLFGATFQAQVLVENDAAESLHFGAVGSSFDAAAPGGPNADFTVEVRYDGARALPLGVLLLRVDAREAGAASAYFEDQHIVGASLRSGEAATVLVHNVPVHLLGGGSIVTLTLVVDGDRDGLNLREADAWQKAYPES